VNIIKAILFISILVIITGCASIKINDVIIPPEPVPEGGWMMNTEN